MSAEINHTTPDKFITITENSISIDLTNIEDLKTADTFTQELSTYIKTRSEINKSSNDINSNAVGSGKLGVSAASSLPAIGSVVGGIGVRFLNELATFFRNNKVPASEVQAKIAREMILLGKEIGLDSMSIKITKGASIGIGADLTGFNTELNKSDDNAIELSVKY